MAALGTAAAHSTNLAFERVVLPRIFFKPCALSLCTILTAVEFATCHLAQEFNLPVLVGTVECPPEVAEYALESWSPRVFALSIISWVIPKGLRLFVPRIEGFPPFTQFGHGMHSITFAFSSTIQRYRLGVRLSGMKWVSLVLLTLAPAVCAQDFERPHWTRDKPFVLLTAATFASAVGDTETTQAVREKYSCPGCRFIEYNPLARPFVNQRATQYAVWTATAGGASWLGWKMKHSRKAWVRKIWWLPQVALIGANTWGITQNVVSLRKPMRR